MTKQEIAERRRLHRRWATRVATRKEIERCLVLDCKAEIDRKARAARLAAEGTAPA